MSATENLREEHRAILGKIKVLNVAAGKAERGQAVPASDFEKIERETLGEGKHEYYLQMIAGLERELGKGEE
jgi:hemerythrin-like domain-containing protein